MRARISGALRGGISAQFRFALQTPKRADVKRRISAQARNKVLTCERCRASKRRTQAGLSVARFQGGNGAGFPLHGLSGNVGGAGGEDARECEERERGEHEERGNGRGVAFNETAFVGFGVHGITIERGNVFRRSRRGLVFCGCVCHNFF